MLSSVQNKPWMDDEERMHSLYADAPLLLHKASPQELLTKDTEICCLPVSVESIIASPRQG